MKKIFFSLLAIAAIASCAKTDAVYEETKSEIKLAPVAALQTKANVLAAIDGTTYPTAENFDVYGYYKNGDASNYTDGESYFGGAVEFTNKGAYWGGVKSYYWPKNGTLRFAAYSPSSLDVDHNQIGDTFSVDGYSQPSNTAETWDFLVAPTSAPYTAMTAAENVAIKFEHALSWITLKVKAKNAEAADVFSIKNVTINGISTTADFAASMLDQEMVAPESWSNWGGENADVEVFNGVQAVTGEAAVIENTTAGTLVIPQATTKVTVTFNQKGVNGTMNMEDMVVELDLVLDKDGEAWKPGYHYTYTLIFGLDEILINPSVDTWEEYIWDENGSQGEINTDNAANVATEAQLRAAVAEGGKIVLQNNIALEKNDVITVDAGKTVVLDLNGYTLSSESTNNSGNYDMFLVKGELTVKDGTVTTKHVGANMIWNAMTTIFDVTAGGLLYLNNVEATNLGGTDMGFVAHLNNWGEVTFVADNSVLTSNYVAVRVFNSGNDMNNVTIYNSTLEGGSNAFWVHNYTAADFGGSEAKAEAHKALLNFDIYNGTNKFIGAKPYTPVRYGMTNALYLDADGNVPGTAVGAASIDELQAALDAAAAGLTTIYLSADLAGNVVATQKAGVSVVINGGGYEFDGVLTVNGQSRYAGEETLVIKNVNFATETTAAMDFISSSTDAVRYAHNVTIENCTFTAPEKTDVVAVRFRQAYNIVVKNCTVKGGHSLAQITSSNNVDFVGCTVEAGRGINLQNALNGVANVLNCNITATKEDGYGVRVDAKGANVLNVKNCAISAYEPIVLRNAEAAYTANLGNNTYTLTNGGTEEIVVLGQTPVINK